MLPRRQLGCQREEAVKCALVAKPASVAKGRFLDLVALGAGRADLRRILVGVDASTQSRVAVQYAANLARATGAKLMLACVVFAPDPLGDPELVARTSLWEEEEQERAEELVREVAAEVTRQGVATEAIVVRGPAAETLAGLAKSGNVDLVVVGRRERSALARKLIGSVAGRLVEICPRPVLVVRGREADRPAKIYPSPVLVVR